MESNESRHLPEDLSRSVIAAAERGDRLAFASAVQRFGTLEDAQELVRTKAVLRMVDRVVSSDAAAAMLPLTAIRSLVTRSQNGSDAETERDTLFGHFTVWERWYEVDSFFEGNFM